jgi:GST-like protein
MEQAQDVYRLFGAPGAGSASVEAALELLGLPYEHVEAAPWGEENDDTRELRLINPLGQVPALVLPDGSVMTESVAILLYLAGRRPDHPAAHTTVNDPWVLRWLMFVATNVYTAIGVGDYPERWVASEAARGELKEGALERIRQSWRIMDEHGARGPYVAGSQLTLLDLYVATMSHWRPGRSWFDENCPRLAACVANTEADETVRRVWSRHF